MKHFFQGHHDFGLDVQIGGHSSGVRAMKSRFKSRTATSKTGFARSTEKLFKEVTEPRSGEMCAKSPGLRSGLKTSAPGLWLIPLRTQPVILAPFLRIFEHGVASAVSRLAGAALSG